MRAGFFEDLVEVLLGFKGFGVDFVHVFCAGGAKWRTSRFAVVTLRPPMGALLPGAECGDAGDGFAGDGGLGDVAWGSICRGLFSHRGSRAGLRGDSRSLPWAASTSA